MSMETTDQELAGLWHLFITRTLPDSLLPEFIDRPMRLTVVAGPQGISASWVGPHES